MQIRLDDGPIEYFPFRIVPPGGARDSDGKRKTEIVPLAIWTGVFYSETLSADALVVTSDLQGTVVENDREFLLGEKLPDFLKLLLELEWPQLNPANIGVVLCGDLYATLEKRGGLGDVKEVWRTFNRTFGWVAGVAGNHDDFGSKPDFEAFKREDGICYLNREIRKIGKTAIGGISGIMGAADKPNRLEGADFLRTLKQMRLKQPEAIVLHQGPDFPDAGLPGTPEIRVLLTTSPPGLVLCGHCHWGSPLAVLTNGTQVLNVDKRVVILMNGHR